MTPVVLETAEPAAWAAAEQAAAPPTIRVLVADDDDACRLAVGRSLERDGYTVLEAADGAEVLTVLRSTHVDLLVLDIGLPLMDGFQVLQRVREGSDVPVIVLSGRTDESDRVLGLELGADDYVLKPYSLKELTARVRARLRRPGQRPQSNPFDVVHGVLTINPASHRVRVGENEVLLTAREFDLLLFMAQHPREVFSREQLLEEVWGTRFQDSSTVTEHVRRVRHKLNQAGAPKDWVTTLRGTGYRFDS